MDIVIVANAPDLDISPHLPRIQATDLLIAADGGARPLLHAGLLPHIVIGDLDSLAPADIAALIHHGVELQRFPRAKDETDLELALLHAAARGATSIDILGALGGRWDHTMSNVALLALPELLGRHVRLIAERQTLFLVRDHAQLTGHTGDTISLIPLTPQVCGITTHGLRYPLTDATLHYERARGVSNILLHPPGSVSLRTGLLLIVQHDDGGAYQHTNLPTLTV